MTETQLVPPALRELLVPGKGTVHNRTAQLVCEGERVVVSESTVTVYVNACDTPSVVAPRLCARRGGWVGFYVGNGTDGAFTGLTLTAATAATAARGS